MNDSSTGLGISSTASTATGVPHEAIARRAYDIYRASGSQPGHCQENWRRAELELQKPTSAGVKSPPQPPARSSMA